MKTNTNPRPKLIYLIVAMTLPCCAALLYFVWLKQSKTAQIVYLTTKLFTIAWPIIVLKPSLTKASTLINLKWARLKTILPLALLTATVMAASIIIAFHIPTIKQLIDQCSPLIIKKVSDLGIQNHFLIFGLLLSTIHSLIEEYYWRWFVFGQLRSKLSPKIAAIIAAFAFAAHHYVILATMFPIAWTIFLGSAVAISGLIWCWLFNKQKSIIGPWIAHIAADLAIIAIAYKIIS